MDGSQLCFINSLIGSDATSFTCEKKGIFCSTFYLFSSQERNLTLQDFVSLKLVRLPTLGCMFSHAWHCLTLRFPVFPRTNCGFLFSRAWQYVLCCIFPALPTGQLVYCCVSACCDWLDVFTLVCRVYESGFQLANHKRHRQSNEPIKTSR